MQSVGLITEYNPFHNGHQHHLWQSLQQAGAEVSVAVMSGHFLQRGEAALLDKWRRTELALAAGVDLILELPFPWACNSAPHFARGAVQALNGLGGVASLCFGSESGELQPLQDCAQLLTEQQVAIEEGTRRLLRQGLAYPLARARILAQLAKDEQISELLQLPNNILGVEYLRALAETCSAIRPLCIRRIGAGYHDLEATGEIASATGIRNWLRNEEQVEPYLPVGVRPLLRQGLAAGETVHEEYFLRLVTARIGRGPRSLRELYQVENGLENRLFEAAEQAGSYEELVAGVKSRQLTRTRVQRLLCYLLNEVRAEQMAAFLQRGPLYLHLLGCSARGERFLAHCRKRLQLPIVGNYSRIQPQLKKFYGPGSRDHCLAQELLELELRATRNYTLLMQNWSGRRRNRDFFEGVRRKT